MKYCDVSLRWASSRDCLVVTDSLELIEKLKQQDREVISLWGLESLPARCIVLTFSKEASRKTFEIAREGGLGRSIFCALHVFEASTDHAEYLLSKVSASNFDLSLSRQAPLLEFLNSARAFKVCYQGQSVGILSLSERATPFATLQEDLESSFIKSVAEFFEIHYAHTRREMPCEFSFNGVLKVLGVLVAARNEGVDDYVRLRAELNNVIACVAKNGAVATVESNRLTSFVVGDHDYIDLMEHAAGVRGLYLTEFAIGVNEELIGLLDYSQNSQLNEGVAGLHVALGDGSTGLHIDFLCPAHSLELCDP